MHNLKLLHLYSVKEHEMQAQSPNLQNNLVLKWERGGLLCLLATCIQQMQVCPQYVHLYYAGQEGEKWKTETY